MRGLAAVPTVGLVPTARDFDRLALRFDAHADELGRLPAVYATSLGSDALIGPHRRLIDQAFQVSSLNLTASSSSMRELAAECRRRAQVCRDFTVEVDLHRRRLADPAVDRFALRHPSAPSWAEYGW